MADVSHGGRRHERSVANKYPVVDSESFEAPRALPIKLLAQLKIPIFPNTGIVLSLHAKTQLRSVLGI